MSKRHLHHMYHRLQQVRYAYFVIGLVVSLTVFILAFRQNNLTAIAMREQLLQVDKANGDVSASLNKLRAYTYSHMNANLSSGENGIYPPIQLKYTYERLSKAESDKADAANTRLYTEAQAYCEQQVTSRVTINRVPCIQDYLTSHGAVTAQAVPDALYKFDFVSPAWSPDLAGWSLVFAILMFVSLLSRGAVDYWFRRQF